MKVELQYFEDCPNWKTVENLLRFLAIDGNFLVDRRVISTTEQAEATGFHGSPTVLVDETDPFAKGDEPVGLSCRIYETPDGPSGSPTLDQLRAVLKQTGDDCGIGDRSRHR